MTTQSSSAIRVLKVLAMQGPASYDELRVRVRPISDEGLTRVIYELEQGDLIHISASGDCAAITDAGRMALSR